MRAYVGERITLKFRVDNREGKDFKINGGDYTVMLDDAVTAAGPLTIKDHEVSFLFSPENPGTHRVSIWYDVGMDRRKGEFLIEALA